MTRPRPEKGSVPISLVPDQGWHCTHWFYRFDRRQLAKMGRQDVAAAGRQFCHILDLDNEEAPQRLQVSLVSGHKADIALMVMDPDPLNVERLHQRLMASVMGPALEPTYSFVSMSEISEYVPTLEQYGEKLVADGADAQSDMYEAKINAYAQREPMMRKQRLTPEFPDWPATCFYPMNKKRKVGENWFTLPFSDRTALMSEHAKSGMAFAGRVTQLITTSVGLDDWEWGVTLWAKNPQYLKEIVYKMRFDEASARYAEFGPFYTSYVTSPEEALVACGVVAVSG